MHSITVNGCLISADTYIWLRATGADGYRLYVSSAQGLAEARHYDALSDPVKVQGIGVIDPKVSNLYSKALYSTQDEAAAAADPAPFGDAAFLSDEDETIACPMPPSSATLDSGDSD